MFSRQITDGEIQFATGETLAHLNYLVQNGNVSRAVNESGLHVYQANPHSHYIHFDEAAA